LGTTSVVLFLFIQKSHFNFKAIHNRFEPVFIPKSLRTGMYEYIEIWYNNSRIHSKIGFISPNEYEESHKERKQKNCLKIV